MNIQICDETKLNQSAPEKFTVKRFCISTTISILSDVYSKRHFI